MSSDFKDHFSGHSEEYKKYRPSYPDELFYHLSHVANNHDCAWDCATGTGQSAVQLAKYFKTVIATDASKNQIRQAQAVKNISYKVTNAEHSGIDSQSIDLITVAQALHWFDLDAFSLEAGRVLVNKGVLAVWTYNLLTINQEIDSIINHLYSGLLEHYWPAERRILETGYRLIHFPFTELDVPHFEMTTHWNLEQLLGYLNTWSAVKRFEADKSVNPVNMIAKDLRTAWDDSGDEMLIKWPLTLRVWQKS